MKNEYSKENHRSQNYPTPDIRLPRIPQADIPHQVDIHSEQSVHRLAKDYPFTEPQNPDLCALCRTFQHVLASAIEVAYDWGTRGSYPELIHGDADLSNHYISMNMANRILYRLEYERDNDGDFTYSAHFSRLLTDLNEQLSLAAKILEYNGGKHLSFSEAAINYLKSIGGNHNDN